MNALKPPLRPLNWVNALLFAIGAAVSFHVAYFAAESSPLRLFIVGYVFCLVQLARLKTTRMSVYTGLATGLLCVAPQLECFWRIFGPAAIPLWFILAFWIAAFTGLTHVTLVRFGAFTTALLVPFVWTGLEYFRSELYYLKFSWLSAGYSLAGLPAVPFQVLGIYGVGFGLAACAALFFILRWFYALVLVIAVVALSAFVSLRHTIAYTETPLRVAGVQMEFPMFGEIPLVLNRLFKEHPDADLFVLSEYTLDGPVPELLKKWCRTHHRHLVVGGKDPAPSGNFYNTAFVVDPNGDIVFRQVKSVPIQFFKDGLPATHQAVWDSPWGKIGICICYDLSYTRVTDGLVKLGAQALVVPTMDVSDWGKRQHELHALVAPVRAAEYGIPIFRLASSGISQAVSSDGSVLARAPFLGEEQSLFARLQLSKRGSMPLDRVLAPLSVGVTILLILALFCSGRVKDNPEQTHGTSDNPAKTQANIQAGPASKAG